MRLGEGKGAEHSDISNGSLEVSQSHLTTLYPFRLLQVFIGVLSEVLSGVLKHSGGVLGRTEKSRVNVLCEAIEQPENSLKKKKKVLKPKTARLIPESNRW